MAGEDLIVPSPPLGPEDLGLGPAPVAPMPPAPMAPPSMTTPPEDFRHKLIRMLAIGTAAGLGPGAGTGLLQGLQGAHNEQHARQREAQATADRQFQEQQNQADKLYQYQQAAYSQQARIYDADAARRQQLVDAKVQSLRKVVPTLKTKDEYDSYINAYSFGLQQQGVRITPNWLRVTVPYVAPNATTEAQKTMDAFLKNPANKAMIEQHPEQIGNIVLRFDRDGDGIPENVKLTDLATIAEQPFATDETGKLIVYPKGTTADTKANADGILQTLLDQAQAEGKAMTPDLKLKYQQQAIKMAAEARPPRPPATNPADKLVKVEHKDPATGKAVIEWLPQSQLAGQKFEKPNSMTLENRLSSAQAVQQTGQDIIQQLSDPRIAAKVGPAMGRVNSLRDFIGNPPPELSELAGSIESYALASMGVHGMRSAQGAAQIKAMLDQKHTPQSLIAAITGLNKFSQHFMENEGRGAENTPDPAASAREKLMRR